MKCLICERNEGIKGWRLDLLYFKNKGITNQESFIMWNCFCVDCFLDYETEYKNNSLFKYWQSKQQSKETNTMLKFPTDDQYPDGFDWFAYDEDGTSVFYQRKPVLSESLNVWTNEGKLENDGYERSENFSVDFEVKNWKQTLRKKGTQSTINKPPYYTWHSLIECQMVSREFMSNLGQAIQYIWRSNTLKPTKGKTTAELIEDLNKAKMVIDFEIERLKAL